MVDGYLLWFLVCFGSKCENPFLFEQVLGHIPLYTALPVTHVVEQEMDKVETFCR